MKKHLNYYMKPKNLLLLTQYGQLLILMHLLPQMALLHRIPWSRGSTYESIIETYSKYVSTNYGEAVVVCDGGGGFEVGEGTGVGGTPYPQ